MENKTSKYFKYAIGEIILVVIGILIALQVSEWNTNRKRQQQETQILKDLHEEFVENRAQLDTVIKYHTNVNNGAKKIIKFFPIDPNVINLDTLIYYHRQQLYMFTFNPQTTTIDALTSTSSFDIITNLELRKLLQRWTEVFKDVQEDELSYIRFMENVFIPYFRKRTSFSDSFKDPRVDLDFLKSLEYENIIRMTSLNIRNILDTSEFNQMNQSIDRIIELTRQEIDD